MTNHVPTASTSGTPDRPVSTLTITKDQLIAAPPEIVFGTLLDLIGPDNEMGPGQPFPMKLEAWPGGRWFRDLGEGRGHLWAHVQVIKAPTLLELCGPMFMSYAATSHVQYRLAADGPRTRLRLVHTAMGLITAEHREGVVTGWDHELDRIREVAERRATPTAPTTPAKEARR